MIKSEKNEPAVVEVLVTYPCIMYSENGHVVLFSEPKVGVVIHAETSKQYTVGFFSSKWSMHRFKLYKGSINLSNEV